MTAGADRPVEEGPPQDPAARGSGGISRRSLLLGGGLGLGIGAVAGAAGALGLREVAADADTATGHAPSGETASAAPPPVPASGARQAGVDRPATPQRNALVVVADVGGNPDASAVLTILAAVGDAVAAVTDSGRADPLVVPDGPGDLVVTIGIGPRLLRALDPALPGATGLPAFASDGDLHPELNGGDMLIAAYSSDAVVLHGVVDHVMAVIPGGRRRWSQAGVRGAGEGTVARNPLGYRDGVIVPRTAEELAENVWITDGPAADGTVAVIRRMRLDVSRFHAQPVESQDRVIGRTRRDGAPLSGGSADDEANLTAKTPEGEYLIPARSHVRAAHPSFTGSALMLRRGYAFSNAVNPGEPADDGLLFMCYQNNLDVFTRTQQRLDASDDLMAYVTVTASASFLIVPGRRDGEPLGQRLAP